MMDDSILNFQEKYTDSDEDGDDSFQDSFQHAVGVTGDAEGTSMTSRDEHSSSKQSGSGIQFLPSNIKGLQTKLNYLLAEYRAGNRSPLTRNEIVSILDELLRRKRLWRKEYRDINTFLK